MFVDPYLANVTIFAGNFAPRGWMFCQGQLLSIANYDALFALIGTTYGGDGVSTFGLPNLQGRVAIHAGQGPGLSNYVLGQAAGTESVTATPLQMPIHNHALVSLTGNPGANSGSGTVSAPNGAVPAMLGFSTYATADSGITMGETQTSVPTPPAGGSQPIPIMQPYLALNYIICVEGIFPSRN